MYIPCICYVFNKSMICICVYMCIYIYIYIYMYVVDLYIHSSTPHACAMDCVLRLVP